MKLIAKIKLQPSKSQYDLLLDTLEVANQACNDISDMAWDGQIFKQFDVHRLAYKTIRANYPLTSQVVVRAIAKVAQAYKVGKDSKRIFKNHGAFPYDNRILRFKTNEDIINIWTKGGRQEMLYLCGDRQKELLEGKRGESDLCFINDEFYLFVSCEVETPEIIDVEGILGVDLGIINIATDSDGQEYSGKEVENNRRKFEHRRANLQRKGTKSTKRKLKKISGKQSRFQKNTNHVISKRLVEKVQGTKRAIALEDLNGIRKATVRHSQRARHANWSFFDLKQKIVYKAKLAGIPVIFVDPKHTSQMCSRCGYISRSNRKSQSSFSCGQCGYSAQADHNAAENISARAVSTSQTGFLPKVSDAGVSFPVAPGTSYLL